MAVASRTREMARGQSVLRSVVVGAGFGLASLAGFRWWERWDRDRPLCTGTFADCFNDALRPLGWAVPVLLLAAWSGLLALRVRRAWLVVLLGAPLNGLAALVAQSVQPRVVVVLLVSAAAWALAGLVATLRGPA